MRVFVLTIGTRGDFELFLTLAAALRRHGHTVVVGTSPFYCARVRDAGLAWAPVGHGTRDEMLAVLRSLAPLRGNDRTEQFNVRWVKEQMRSGMPLILHTANAAEYFVSNVKMVLSRDDVVIPGATVTYDPPGSFQSFEKSLSPERQGRTMDLVAMPQALADPERRWPAWVRFTGFWMSDPATAAAPSPALAAFVERGSPPIVVTLGSMLMVDATRLAPVLMEVLARTDRRAVVVGGWADLGRWPASDRLHAVSEAPYDWLFSRAACVIHHGGTGTVAAVLRAGTPSILLPQLTAQARFARMLTDAELATGVFDAETLSVDALAEAVRRAVGDPRVRASAARWQQVVAADPGVDGAVALIEAHAAELARG
jgi:UDP:flavonoid glycosyltransferase YjiC (YdhE family)